MDESTPFVNLNAIFKTPDSIVDNFLLPAKGIDWLEDASQIKNAARRASEQGEVLFLYGHRIGNSLGGKSDRNYIDVDILLDAVEFISSLNLRFYTFNDL